MATGQQRRSGTKGASGQRLLPWRQPCSQTKPARAPWAEGQPQAAEAACTPAKAARAPSLPSSLMGEPVQVH